MREEPGFLSEKKFLMKLMNTLKEREQTEESRRKSQQVAANGALGAFWVLHCLVRASLVESGRAACLVCVSVQVCNGEERR